MGVTIRAPHRHDVGNPKDFFSAPENVEHLNNQYDYMPEITNILWDKHDDFINWRKQLMLAFLKSEYGLSIKKR